MPKRFESPELERRCVCVTNDPILAALVSSFFRAADTYFAVFNFPLIDEGTKPKSIEASRAEVAQARIHNSIARLQPDLVVFAGFNRIQWERFAYLPASRVGRVENAKDIADALASLTPRFDGELRCLASDIAQGLVMARRLGKRLTHDPTAGPLVYERERSADGIIVAERRGDVSDVIAANYAFALGADFELIEPFDHGESSRINSLLTKWGETGSVDARAELAREVESRFQSTKLCGYRYATFFTRGLPYGFVFGNHIPISHVASGINDDQFIFDNVLMERARTFFDCAVVFSPGKFDDEETMDVICRLRDNNYVVRDLIGNRATAGNLHDYVAHYPYDVLHICSHGGEISGYHCVREFRDRVGDLHRVEFDEVVAFRPAIDNAEMVHVTTKALPRKLDGLLWMSPELRARSLPQYIFEDMFDALVDDSCQPTRTFANDVIAGSCCIVCENGIHQGTFERLASDHFPFVFNNTCASWHDIAMSFIDAGCRGYIGTLWPIRNDTACKAARLFYDRCWTEKMVEAFHSMVKSIDSLADRDIYIFWGLHFSTINRPARVSNAKIVAELLRSTSGWVQKVNRDGLSPFLRKACGEALKTVLHLLIGEPGVRESVEEWYLESVRNYPKGNGEDDGPAERRCIELPRRTVRVTESVH